VMDRFEEFVSGSRVHGPGGFADEIERLAPECGCPECPTYNDCSEGAGERLYCLIGRSFGCMTENLGCACSRCRLHRELGLRHDEYCLRGPEAAQRFERTLP